MYSVLNFSLILMFFSRISVHVTLDIKANAGRPLAQILQCYKMLFSCHITAKIKTYQWKLKLFPFLGGLNKSAKSGAPEFCMWNFISGKADFFLIPLIERRILTAWNDRIRDIPTHQWHTEPRIEETVKQCLKPEFCITALISGITVYMCVYMYEGK